MASGVNPCFVCLFLSGRPYLQEQLRPVPQAVGEDGGVEGLDAFLVEPALTAGVILGQILEVGPTGHLEGTSHHKGHGPGSETDQPPAAGRHRQGL